jgi:hypothetical protein
MTAPTRQDTTAFADAMMLLGAVVVGSAGLLVLLLSHDAGMAFHGLLFLIAAAAAAMLVLQISFHDESALEVDGPYVDGPIEVATIAALIWGIAGFVAGDFIAWQLAFPQLNFDLPWISFGRMRPLHTSAVIFAFGDDEPRRPASREARVTGALHHIEGRGEQDVAQRHGDHRNGEYQRGEHAAADHSADRNQALGGAEGSRAEAGRLRRAVAMASRRLA